MSLRVSRWLLCSVLVSAAAIPVAAQDVENNVEAQPTAPAPASGSVQSAPNTTVVQPAAAPAPQAERPVVQETHVHHDDDPPSVFVSAAQGLLAGTLVGSSGGYLVGRRDGWERSDWRAVGLGAGIGALSGTGFGLMLGLMDRGGARAGRYIPRDMLAGAGVGALVGVIGGGIAAARADEGERVLLGTTIGVISGAGLGIVTGIIEGTVKNNRESRTTQVTSRVKLRPSLAWSRARGRESGTLTTGLVGTF